MSDPTDFDSDEQLLPGLGEPAQVAGPIELAAHRTIAGLVDRLDESDAVMCQALLTAARQLDRATVTQRAKPYGVADLLAQLRETFLTLRGEDDGGGGESDPFDELAGDLRDAARRAVGSDLAG